MPRIRRFFGVALIVALAGPWAGSDAWAKAKDIRVIGADNFGLTLELHTPGFQVKKVKGPDGVYQRLDLPGWARTPVAGAPELPVTGLLIQVPRTGKLSVQVLEKASASLRHLKIYPVPKLTRKGPEFLKDAKVYQSSQNFPGTVAAVSRQNTGGGLAVARVMFYPFQWNPLTGELQYSRVIRVRVNFQDSLPPAAARSRPAAQADAGGVIENLLKSNLPNFRRPAVMAQDKTPQSLLNSHASPDALRVEVKQDGIYKLSFNDLANLGIKVNEIDPATFQLFNRDQEVAIRMASSSAAPATWNQLEFYGQALNNAFTDTNVYWLRWGQGPGKRMAVVPAAVTGQGTGMDAFQCSLHREENQTIWEATPGAPAQDYWFWELLTAPVTRDYTVNLPAPVTDGRDAVLRLCFRGYTTAPPLPNHHTRISLNGTQIGDSRWDNDLEDLQEMHFSSSLLHEGANTVTVALPGDTGAVLDMAFLNWIEVDYPRRFEAAGNTLTFAVSGEGKVQVEIGHLDRSDVSIYDITDPFQVKILDGFQVSPDTGGYRAVFEDTLAGTKNYCLLTQNLFHQPPKPALWHTVNLKNADQGADYILITPRDFLPSLESLGKFRQMQGYRVGAVAVEDIYDEFSYGIFDPQAIKDFLNYAYQNWQKPAPTYVLLVGDANTDYRDYLGTGKKNRVPVHLTYTADLGLTPDDNWYVAFGSDGLLPEMLIGRIPGANGPEAGVTAAKIVDYEASSHFQFDQALFVADNGDPAFQETAETLTGYLSGGYAPLKIYLDAYPKVSDATQALIDDINAGVPLTTYVGHGDVTDWTGDGLFDPSNIPLLTNRTQLTFVMALDCLNGYFSQPFRYCLGEEFVIAPNKGAVASFVPSGLGYTWEHVILGSNVLAAIFQQGQTTLGAITTQAKINAYSQGATPDLVKIFTLIGDPATRLQIGP